MQFAVFLALLSLTLAFEENSSCAKGWVAGDEKCYRVIPGQPKPLRQAWSTCLKLGGNLFAPKNKVEIQEITRMMLLGDNDFGLSFYKDHIWIGYRLKDASDRSFPPKLETIMHPRKSAPNYFTTLAAKRVYFPEVEIKFRSGAIARRQAKFIKMVRGSFKLAAPTERGFSARVLCEAPKSKRSCGDSRFCYQPQSIVCDKIEYSGETAVSEMGYECAAWNDESVHPHKYTLNNASHNFCRNPTNDQDGPWCYTTDPDVKWDRCAINQCLQPKNEFLRDQADCGRQPLKTLAQRVVGGRKAELGEVPWQARLRYKQKQRFGTAIRDHQCGATIISSCWIVTAAHCIVLPDYARNRMSESKAEKEWREGMRVDVGTRFHHSDTTIESFNADHGIRSAKFKDALSFQSFRIKKVKKHSRFNDGQHFNDIALLQLYPSQEDGKCIIFDDLTQPACINNNEYKFGIEDDCQVSGWGQTNAVWRTDGGRLPNHLRVASVAVQDFQDCKYNYSRIKVSLRENMHMCAGSPGVDSCQGDSGGPLICVKHGNCIGSHCNKDDERGYLIGVVSFGKGCAQKSYPGVYAHAGKYFNWIKKEVEFAGENNYDSKFVCHTPDCV